MTDTLISYAAVQAAAFSDTNLVGRVLGDADGRARVEELLQEQKIVSARAARGQPAPRRGAARRAARAARAHRPRDHRRAEEAEGERRTDEVDLRDQRSSSAALVAPATPMPELRARLIDPADRPARADDVGSARA